MIRKDKVRLLTEAGVQIRVYPQQTDNRFRIEAIFWDGKWHHYNTMGCEQAEAGKLINKLYNLLFFGEDGSE